MRKTKKCAWAERGYKTCNRSKKYVAANKIQGFWRNRGAATTAKKAPPKKGKRKRKTEAEKLAS